MFKIDLNDKKKIIYLKRIESNEICILNSNERNSLKDWLKILCKNCGFHESYKIKTSKNPKTLRELLNQSSYDSNRRKIPSIIHKKSPCLIVGTNNVNTKLNSKQIAGLVSPQVGSFTEYPPVLRVLFPSGRESSLNHKLGYLCLEDCTSGVDNSGFIQIEKNYSAKSLIDLAPSDDTIRNKITYVPLEVLNGVEITDSNSQLSDSSSLNNYQKIYDLEVNKSFTFSKNNLSNVTGIDIPYTYLDVKRTEALKNTIRDLKKQF